MPLESRVVNLQGQYSPFTGLVYIFNLIVGTGALTLPAAFANAGWLLSSVIIILLAFMSYLTTTFMIESMASANAIVHHRRVQRVKRSRTSRCSEASTDDFPPGNAIRHSYAIDDSSNENDNEVVANESEPLLSATESDINSAEEVRDREDEGHYAITEIFEMGKMASLFFSRTGRVLFYLCLTIYLYGDLAIYGAAVAKSLRDVACTYMPDNTTKANVSELTRCWSGSDINRADAYRVALAVFVATVGPFAFYNVTKTKYLQIVTTAMRWLAFGIMVTLACIRLANGNIYSPPVSQLSGIPNLFGVCIYSFMCHHSLPSLVTPISRKRHVNGLIGVDYAIILTFYFLLAFTGIFAYEKIDDLYTLNFQPEPGESWFMALIHYFLTLFPVFTLSTNFPIIAITLRNNLKALFLTEGRMYSWFTRKVIFPLMALVPPVAVAFATNSLEFLVGITGSYAGAGIQYIVPAFLVYYSRKATNTAIGVGVNNHHSSWFKSNVWVVFVNLWATTCIVLVTWNHIAQAVKKDDNSAPKL